MGAPKEFSSRLVPPFACLFVLLYPCFVQGARAILASVHAVPMLKNLMLLWIINRKNQGFQFNSLRASYDWFFFW